MISLLIVNGGDKNALALQCKTDSKAVHNHLALRKLEITSAAKLYYNSITKHMSPPYSTNASLVLCMVSKFIHTSITVQKGQMNVDGL